MSFVSLTWAACLWLTIGLYWLAPREWRPWVLMGLSLGFMAVVDLLSAGLLVAAWGMTTVGIRVPQLTLPMLVGIGGVMVTVLVGFKLEVALDPQDFLTDVGIPLGLSYYTFRCLHVLIEKFKGTLGPATASELASYLFFVPTFVIGPIHRFRPFIRDQKRQRFDLDGIFTAAERIILGYVKIVVLSNLLTELMLGQIIGEVAADAPGFAAYLTIVQNGLNIYLQFSGHSDVAIGFAAALGFKVIENFDRPYLQPNISAFWRSWHISLSQWCREYIYGPVVARTRKPALGALVTMVVIGLWHEVSVRYMLWGAYHGLGIVVWQRFHDAFPPKESSSQSNLQKRLLHGASVLLTVHFVWFGFIVLTTPNLSDIPNEFLTVFGFGGH
ncbi:MBOAT family O-acyltransferase [Donghicola tyrosinivorans]|uniref:Probable alginate O-acetylase AlgI n=1 Tax=Donghicola tyrosinivorans TaxID=1652492 RepID=A0A2T0WEV1_9RHOB|nr:MBOAT family O-acyltransferase [Donghicola tyrosinivorans]PRY85237.1 alginate O-acetyltransferase complex protein AlgI [Donghicola tyrosinivorans]